MSFGRIVRMRLIDSMGQDIPDGKRIENANAAAPVMIAIDVGCEDFLGCWHEFDRIPLPNFGSVGKG